MAWQEWVRTVEVEPSLYAADFARLGEQIDVLLRAGCRILHFDVGDGHFVEPVTIGPVVLESIAPLVHQAGGVLDCHLMVDNPLRHFPQIARAGGDSVTFHYEVVDDVPATIAAAREHGLQAGVAFNPGVPLSMKSCASKCDREGSGDPAACTIARCPWSNSGFIALIAGCSPKYPSRSSTCSF